MSARRRLGRLVRYRWCRPCGLARAADRPVDQPDGTGPRLLATAVEPTADETRGKSRATLRSLVSCPRLLGKRGPSAQAELRGHMLRRRISVVALAGVLFFALLGCQGRPKEKPPIHVNPNMDNQPKYMPQEENPFFANRSADRLPVEGTIARGRLKLNDRYYRGIDPATGEPVEENPVEVTRTSLARGRERFDIYCAVCHGKDGSGRSIMLERGFTPPPSFHEDPVLSQPDGHYFDVITNGIRNMPGYENQIPVRDRWLIVQYLRALQRSQRADISDVPAEQRDKLK
ncbi:MAG: hypothetical protein MAG453_00805 [Calditrichaeota bacterium]|nr:hypothetical protein [Calditrichota bacterium]